MKKEIEIRGPISDISRVRNTVNKLGQTGTIESKIQTAIFFDPDADRDLFFILKYTQGKHYFDFVLKKRLNNQDGIYEESVVAINIDQFNQFLSILDSLGLKRAKIASISMERVDIYTPEIIWSFRFGGVFEAYWEAEISDSLYNKFDGEPDPIIKYLNSAAVAEDLSVWSSEEYKQYYHAHWAKVATTPTLELKLGKFDTI